MKKLFALLVFSGFLLTSFTQESMEKVMEKRAREMHRVIGLTDKDQWKMFVKENYTQALIDKPMKARIQTSEDGNTSATAPETKSADNSADNIEAKASMFQQLHSDFGNSKIISLKPADEKLTMVVKNDSGMTGTFNLKFDKASPYKIDKLSIEAGDANR